MLPVSPPLISRASFLAAGAALLLAGVAHARAGSVETFGGEKYEGDVHLDAGAVNIASPNQPAQRVDLANILKADFQDKDKAVIVDGLNPGVQLRNGTLIGGHVLDLDATAVHLNVGKETKDIPLANVACIVFAPVPRDIVRKIPAGFVGAILPGGDLYEGDCRGMEDRPVRVRINSPIMGMHRFDVKEGEILAVALHDLAPGTPDDYQVRATDGSQYNVGSLQTSTDGVTIHDTVLGDLKIGVKQLAQITAGDARVQPVGLLRASAVNSVNPAKIPAVFSPDAMPSGGPITLAGQTYAGGITQAAGVAITFPVPPNFSVFMAKIGLPEGAPPGIYVVYQLATDGRPVWRSQPVLAGAPPAPVRWNLGSGVRTLTLYVEAPQPASLGTTAAWADALLLKQ